MFRVENHGSIVLIQAEDAAARTWIDERVDQIAGFQPYLQSQYAIVCEPRYVESFVQALEAEGMEVRS